MAYPLETIRGWMLAASFVGIMACGGCATYGAPSSNPWEDPSRIFVHGSLGLGLPEGNGGLGAGVRPTPWSTLELGGGLSTSGGQASIMAGLRGPSSKTVTVGVSTGLSIGPEIDHEPDATPFVEEPVAFRKEWRWVLWSNSELQARSSIGETSVLRARVGVPLLIDHATPRCGPVREGYDEQACERRQLVRWRLPYVGIGFEHGF